MLDSDREGFESDNFVYHKSFDDKAVGEVILEVEPVKAREREQHLFRTMNYLRCRVGRIRERAAGRHLGDSEQRELEEFIRKASGIRRRLIEENMGLVVDCARRRKPDGDLSDLVSESYPVLIRAVEEFDFSRGGRFSTYACFLIDKGMLKQLKADRTHRLRHSTGNEQRLAEEPDIRGSWPQQNGQIEDEPTRVVSLLPQLDPRDRTILEQRFGVGGVAAPATLKAVATDINVSQERVRQLEDRALSRLRRLAEANGIWPQDSR